MTNPPISSYRHSDDNWSEPVRFVRAFNPVLLEGEEPVIRVSEALLDIKEDALMVAQNAQIRGGDGEALGYQ